MGYSMYVCPECRKVFKVQGNDKKVKCNNCSTYLKDMHVDFEDWGVMDKAGREEVKNKCCEEDEVIEIIEEDTYEEEPIKRGTEDVPKPVSSTSGSFFGDFDDNFGNISSAGKSTGSGSFFDQDTYTTGSSASSTPEEKKKSVIISDYNYSSSERSGHSKLSIIALILGALGCTAVVGLILAIIDLAKSKDDDKKHVCSWICVGIASLWLVGGAILGIGGGGNDNKAGKKEITDSSSVAESVEQDSSAENTDQSNDDESGSESESRTESASSAITIDEQVLIDEDGLKITAMEYVTDSIWGDGIKFLIENNMSSDIGIGCDALIVNDYMISDLFSSTIAAGKKANEIMYLSNSQLRAAGIDNVGQIEIYMHTYDADSYSTIKKFPCFVIKTSAYENMDITVNDEGKELFNENGIRIVGKYVDEDSFWGAAVLLYIENSSGKNVTIQCEDLSINGFMMTPFFSSTVYDGKRALDDITLMSSELESNGITSIDDIELKFHIFDENYTTVKDTDVISFSAK